jgi:PPM family protein phosphatase
MKLVVGAATDVGRIREINEDGYLVDEGIGLIAVADGMGGHRAGEVASATALEALRASVRNGNPLREAIEKANDAVFEKSVSNDDFRGMGTTLTAGTLAAGNTLIVGHVGDSRAYLLRDGEFRQLTTDHSRVQELVDDGRLTADEAAVHPMRNIVTRALGVDSSVDVDVYPLQLELGDVVLFCSDGLTGMLQDEFVGAELRRESDPARVATRLVDEANRAGGEDNITVVVIGVVDEPPDRPDPKATVVTAAPVPVPEVVEEAPPEPEPRARRRRGFLRALIWIIPVLVILGIAMGAIAWYARHNYYVAASLGRVAIYKGVSGGLLWFDPTLDRRTAVRVADLRPSDAEDVRARHTFSSRADAVAFVRRLEERPPTTTTTTTTTTTLIPTTTTLAPAPAP